MAAALEINLWFGCFIEAVTKSPVKFYMDFEPHPDDIRRVSFSLNKTGNNI